MARISCVDCWSGGRPARRAERAEVPGRQRAGAGGAAEEGRRPGLVLDDPGPARRGRDLEPHGLDADGPRRPDAALLAQAFHAINAVASGGAARDSSVASHVEELEQLSAKIAEVTSEDPQSVGSCSSDRCAYWARMGPVRRRAGQCRPCRRDSVTFRASVAENEGDVEGMRRDATCGSWRSCG